MTEPQIFQDDEDEQLLQSLSHSSLTGRIVLWLLVCANVLLVLDWLALAELNISGERERQGLFVLLNMAGLAFLILQGERGQVMEEDFRLSEQKFHRLFERSGEAMLLCDPKDTQILRANAMAVYLFKQTVSELKQSSLRQLCTTPISSALSATLKTGHAVAQNIRLRAGAGETIPVELSLSEIYDGRRPYLFAIVRDFREEEERQRRQEEVIGNLERTSEASLNIIEDLEIQRQELQSLNETLSEYRDRLEVEVEERTNELVASQEQLHRAQRMASIGALAAGVAHEINNPIGVLVLTAQNALDQLDDSQDHRGLLERTCERILTQAGRCSRIVKGVLQFARQQPTEKWENDINSIIKATLQLLSETFADSRIKIKCELADRLPQFMANPIEIEQVFTNLIQNSIQSSRGTPVTVLIKTSWTAGAIEAVIQDDGPGIKAENLAHVFDPFFTTRQQEGGTGLGLSIVHGIVTGHGGTIEIVSGDRKGTMITIRLPGIVSTKEGQGLPS